MSTVKRYLFYIKYFFFITFNWSVQLAVFTLYHEVRGEKKYGVDTADIDDLSTLHLKGPHGAHAEIYQAANYYILEKCFDELKRYNLTTLVDMGCGKGRIMAVAAFYGYQQITGIDFATELCREAEANINKIKLRYPDVFFSVVNADVLDYKIRRENLFFLFNPFDEIIVADVVNNLLSSLRRFPRTLYIVYINPQHKQIFVKKGFRESFYMKRLRFVEASILLYDGVVL